MGIGAMGKRAEHGDGTAGRAAAGKGEGAGHGRGEQGDSRGPAWLVSTYSPHPHPYLHLTVEFPASGVTLSGRPGFSLSRYFLLH